MNFYEQLGVRIKTLRENKGLTQERLAGLMGIGRPAVAQMEKGKRRICTEEAVRVSEIFRIPLDALVDPSKDVEVVLEEAKKKEGGQRPLRISVPQKNLAKFREVLLYILGKVGSKLNVGETVLYKVLYFIDFDFYEKYEEQLIGATYIKNRYGPTPCEFKKVIERMVADNEVEEIETEYRGYRQTRYIASREPDLSILGGHEIKLIDDVLNRLSDMNAAQISEYSHGDIPWLTTEDGEVIKYESVFYRGPLYSVRQYDEEVQEDLPTF
jgi:transcriptional regulator with XRE-family HTH domain